MAKTHFHHDDGYHITGRPDDEETQPKIGDKTTISGHAGTVVKDRPYGLAHDHPLTNLPPQPQDIEFSPSRRDVVIKLDIPHGVQNPNPNLLAHGP